MHSDLRNTVGDWGEIRPCVLRHTRRTFPGSNPFGRALLGGGRVLLAVRPFSAVKRVGAKGLGGVSPQVFDPTLRVAPSPLASSLRRTFAGSNPFAWSRFRMVSVFLRNTHFRRSKVVGAKGFEPSTSWSQTRRSTRLSYAPLKRGVKRRRIRIAVKNILKSIAIERTSIGITSVDAYRMA